MFNKTAVKFGSGFIAIVALAVGVWYTAIYFDPDARAEREAMRYLGDLEEQYKNDTYGGKTPEETLELFITALEKDDIELASKYFLPENVSKQLDFLTKVRKNKNLPKLIEEISGSYDKRDFLGDGSYFIFLFRNLADDTERQISVARIPNGVWKIVDM